jgi:hypothetical protein
MRPLVRSILMGAFGSDLPETGSALLVRDGGSGVFSPSCEAAAPRPAGWFSDPLVDCHGP